MHSDFYISAFKNLAFLMMFKINSLNEPVLYIYMYIYIILILKRNLIHLPKNLISLYVTL